MRREEKAKPQEKAKRQKVKGYSGRDILFILILKNEVYSKAEIAAGVENVKGE